MAYVSPNYRTKTDLKRGLADGQHVTVYQPGLGTVPQNGPIALEGPHAPACHSWHGVGIMQDGRLISVK